MNIRRSYSLVQILKFTKKQLLIFTLWSLIPVGLHLLEIHHLSIPWLPVALLGTASAFLIGFKNNASYDRVWESRKVWEGIENKSKALFMYLKPFFKNVPEFSQDEIYAQMLNYHLAWVHALRLQLRDPRPWEHKDEYVRSFHVKYHIENSKDKERILSQYLTKEELAIVLKQPNAAVKLLDIQIEYLSSLRIKGYIEEIRLNDMVKLVLDLNDLQTKTERTKNFPFPRQYASINKYFVNMFIFLVPFGLVSEFSKLEDSYLWMSIPFSVLVCWVFKVLQLVSDYSENPYEGLFNDIPVNRICQRIESDIKIITNLDPAPYNFESENEYGIVI